MKIVAIGDIHGRDCWKTIVEREKDADQFVFVGDYFDTRENISSAEQIYNYKEIIRFKQENPEDRVILLLGNHDVTYFNGCRSQISGLQENAYVAINQILEETKHLTQMAHRFENLLFTHAGVSQVFMDQVFGIGGWDSSVLENEINDLWKWKPLAFLFNMTCYSTYGDDVEQSPIWIRPRSLMQANQSFLRKYIIQIVGHTGQEQIDIKGKATGGRYYFIDTFDTSGEYLIIEDGKFSSKTYKDVEDI